MEYIHQVDDLESLVLVLEVLVLLEVFGLDFLDRMV
jgi:hypothetical protein